MKIIINAVAFIFLIHNINGEQCSINIEEIKRRECYPWTDPTKEKCEERGCIWCPTNTPNIPHCVYNDAVCPSTIPEGQRIDCHLEPNANRERCNAKGCIWCDASPGMPACFTDPSVSQGGDLCPPDIDEKDRVDCHPEKNANKQTCLSRGCFWCQSSTDNVPWCFAPKQHGYRIIGQPINTVKGLQVNLQRINRPSWFSKAVDIIQVNFEFQEDDRLRIKIFDPNNNRFEVPLNIESETKADNPLYDIEFQTDNVFGFKVVRKSTGQAIWDTTSLNGLTFEDQYIQIVNKLNAPNIFGFGEQEHHSLKHSVQWKSFGMWTRDLAVTTENLYGVHPYYINIESTKNAHSVLFKNANAQDVTLSPSPALTYRTIGGVLDIYIFMGPTIDELNRQYMKAIGNPVMIPYWGLGFQLCRWGYRDLNHMKEAVNRMRQYDIPHDLQYGDIDYMDGKRDFTIDPENFADLPNYVDQLKSEGTQFIIILDPAIKMDDPPGVYPTFDAGNRLDVWVKKADGETPAEGEVWPGKVYFPDFHKPSTTIWWIEECRRFKQRLDYAGIWIDMNEPASFVHGSPTGCENGPLSKPPYLPRIADNMYEKTICAEFTDSLGKQYNTHSLYGWSHVEPTYRAARAVTGKRSVTFSRSTYPGISKFGQHWLGDNFSLWSNMRYSVIAIIEWNWFGFPYIGADICGFIHPTTEELCQRWQQLGAFYTFSRNHNGKDYPDQDPGMWPSVAAVTRKTLHIRYTLLPYLYTLFYHSHKDGVTVIRGLLQEFTDDETTWDITDQFMWSKAFMISPVLDQGQTSVNVYFPDSRWFSYYDGQEVDTRNGFKLLNAPLDFIPLHIRGGYILPTQQPSNSTLFSRKNPMGLIISLNDNSEATGDLFWDDGDSQDTYEKGEYYYATYSLNSNDDKRTLTNSIVSNGYAGVATLSITNIRIMGEETISQVLLNSLPISEDNWEQDGTTNEIKIMELDLKLTEVFSIEWM